MTEAPVDAIVVGARCAGAAAAIALARTGRRVIAVDRARFPSDTLSTHLLFAGGVAELKALGVLERVEALGAPRMPAALMGAVDHVASGGYTPADGIDYALCVRRPGLDAALVDAARAAGADVREGARVVDLVRDGPRVVGVRVAERDGGEAELRAKLVVGADGRRSTVARLLGVTEPYRSNPNGRACFFAYFDDGRPEWRATAAQWRAGRELGTAFPCDGGRVLVLLMPPVDRAAAFRADPEREYDRTIDAIAPLRERLRSCTRATKVRGATDLPSYFRRSSGAGWALPGDAGHFKDPVTAQGIRDALRFGRRLGEIAAPSLDDPAALDRALAAWEHERERECLETYHWTNVLARGDALSPLEVELYRRMGARPGLAGAMLDVFARTRRPSEAFTLRLSAGLVMRALIRPGADRREILRTAARDAGADVRARAERRKVHRAAPGGEARSAPHDVKRQTGWTLMALGPFSPGSASYETRAPSARER